jgi:flavin reductase (DIM6/NTAB) family NADH-FMN oxidoreductase RutF
MMKRVGVGQALKLKYPEWIDLVVSKSADGRVNVMPVGWSMITSGTPAMYAVAINKRHYTTQAIRGTRAFVIAAPAAGMGPATWYCGTHSGHDGDKIGPSGLTLVPAAHIDTPLIEGAVYNLECTLHSELETGDHILFVGEIVAAHMDEDVGDRLLNFGSNIWAQAKIVPGSVFRCQA